MNILLSADCFYPAQLGGPGNTLYWLAKALTRAGHAVTVIATAHQLPPHVPVNQWLSMDCGRVRYTTNPHFYLPLRHIRQGWAAIPKADIVHVNSLFYPASLIWVLRCRLTRTPVIWSPHGELNPVALGFRPQLKRLILWAIGRIIHSSVQFQAANGAEAAHIRHWFGTTVTVTAIRNRMELPTPVYATETAPISTPYLLFMGRLHPIKAIDNLIRALAGSELFRASDFSLVVAGPLSSSDYGRFLTKLLHDLALSDKVNFVGTVEGRQKEILYANARLTILPSHAESFGNVVIESLAQGTPVLASTGTPWQQLATERAGSWVPNDPESLREAVDHYIRMPADAYNHYRERAYALAHQQFDIHKNIGEWEQLYRQAMPEKNVAHPVLTTDE